MKALVKYERGYGNLEIRNIDEPKPKKGQAKIAVKAAGICGTDIHVFHDQVKFNLNIPVILGHEFSGQIVELGPEVSDFKVGDRVVPESTFSVCEKCYFCLSGNSNICKKRFTFGSAVNGAFADFCIVNTHYLHKLPDNVSFREAALLEPLAMSVNAVDQLTNIKSNDVVVITGPGPIGLLNLQLAKSNGAYVILCGTQKDERRLNVGQQLGADKIIYVDKEDALTKILNLTAGLGADIILECSGSANAIELGLNAIRRNGKIVQIGLSGKKISISFELIAYKQIKVFGVFGSTSFHWKKALSYIQQGKVLTEPLISHEISLEEWEKGFMLSEQKKAVKVLFRFDK